MNADLIPFNYGEAPIRALLIGGEPWFVLADLCAVLAIANVGNVAARLDQAGIRQTDIRSGGQRRAVTIVDEAGMYEVVIRSDKPEAVKFRRWITAEVLPAIRRTGSYSTTPAIEGDELMARALKHATEVLARKDEAIAELAPKAEAFDSFLDATGKYGVGAVAKMLGTSQNKLYRDLRNCGVLIAKGAMRNTPYQQYMHHFEVRAHEFERSNGELGCSYTTYVQPSGIDFIRRKLRIDPPDPPAAGLFEATE